MLPHACLELPAVDLRMFVLIAAMTMGGRQPVRSRDVRATAAAMFNVSGRQVNRQLARLRTGGWVTFEARVVALGKQGLVESHSDSDRDSSRPGQGLQKSHTGTPDVPLPRVPHPQMVDGRSLPRAHAHEQNGQDAGGEQATDAVVKKTIADAKKLLTATRGKCNIDGDREDGPRVNPKGDSHEHTS